MFSKIISFFRNSSLIFSLFKKRKGKYKVAGSCSMCGKCCRRLILGYRVGPVRSLRQFRKLVKNKPFYEMFVPHEEVPKDGFLRFCCKHVTDQGKCSIHDQRPDLCRRYPDRQMLDIGGTLPDECGYSFVPEADFDELLDQELAKKKKKN